jgi:hypothetical protein
MSTGFSYKINTLENVMPRIRTVKPDLFRHVELFETEKKYNVPIRTAFIGLLTCCDREGRFRWQPRQLKLDILPYDEVDFSLVLDALLDNGFIEKYTVEGKDYGFIPSWNRHQVINHKESKSCLPVPTPSPFSELNINASNTGSSYFINREREQESPRDVEVQEDEEEKIIQQDSEPVRKQSKVVGSDAASSGIDPLPGTRITTQNPVEIIFEYWCRIMNQPNSKLDNSRRSIIQNALRLGFSQEALQNAILGCKKTPYYMGENKQGEFFNGLHIIFRDASQIEKFMRHHHSPPCNVVTGKSQMNRVIIQKWLNQKIA